MIRAMRPSSRQASEREALRRRIKLMYDGFNRELWEKCFSLIDPNLREPSKLSLSNYADRLRAFKEVYGSIRPWHIRISLHLSEKASKQDTRPFAYVYVVWQDDAHTFHMFRERWVKVGGRWFTRVVGLVANQQH